MLVMANTARTAAGPRSPPTSQQFCQGKTFQEQGNSYCKSVQRVTYESVGISGQYKEVVSMNDRSGDCQFAPRQFSGPLAPFNKPLSLQFRGPLNLKQVAVAETPTTKAPTRSTGNSTSSVEDCDAPSSSSSGTSGISTITSDLPTAASASSSSLKLSVVRIVDTAASGRSLAMPPPPMTTSISNPSTLAAVLPSTISSSIGASSVLIPSSSPGAGSETTASFFRTGYYNAEKHIRQGLMFLGNYGGQGSGTFREHFGSSLAYLNANGTGGASKPATLKDTLLLSSQEATLLTDQPCDASCGYIDNGTVAYKGFLEPIKIFLLDFAMPHNTAPFHSSNSRAPGNDKPAVWFLRRTSPTLPTKSHMRWAGHAGGDDTYFERPAEGPARLAVVFDGERGRVSLQVSGKGAMGGEFPEALGRELTGRLMNGDGVAEGQGSMFRIGVEWGWLLIWSGW
ncbi:hypothetical protein VTI74DRAFT_4526 [Chaetomium olivicolor]